MVRKTLLLLSLSLPLLFVGAARADAPPDDAGVLDAAPASTGAPPPAVIIVNPNTGTVTPLPGTLPDQVKTDPVGTAGKVYAAIKGGQWRLLAAFVLAAIMVLGVKFTSGVFGKTDRGKATAVMVLAMLGTLSAALAGVLPLTGQLFIGAGTVALTAVGGRKWIASLLWPQDGGEQWLVWLKPFLGVGDAPKPPAVPTELPADRV